MADVKTKLSTLLQRTGLNAKRQDGKILLYNREIDHLCKGIAVDGIEAAVRMVSGYAGYLRAHRWAPLVEWAKDHQIRPLPFKEVPNKADSQSPYYVASMSSVSRINLLKAAKELRSRVHTARALREDSPVTDSDVRRYLKIKKIAAIYREDSEKVGVMRSVII